MSDLIEGLRISARVIRDEAGTDHIAACRMDGAVERIRELEAALHAMLSAVSGLSVKGRPLESLDIKLGNAISRARATLSL